MIRKFILPLALNIVALTTMAQQNVDAQFNHIREAYAARLKMMENQPYGEEHKVEQMTISYSRNYPGTGLQERTTTFYWTDEEDETYMLKPTLYFVTSQNSLNFGLYRFSREYLLDAVTEEPLFMLASTQLGDDGERQEYRFYFDHGHLIKQVPEQIVTRDGADTLAPDISLDANGRAVEAALIAEFNIIKENFHNNIATFTWQ